jgi:hypothetical protein
MLAGITDRLDGLVVAGMGVGHVPGASREEIAASFAVAGGYADPTTWPWPLPAA